ncbi:hypothetical protein C8F04DRAFT_1096259 [Mycena alexandri]|uniref:MYND-type domain-containing protein n=1 Tax=Mycena alexandri TaxID=1745969 RepID=A0AAD6T1I2_9AGAR|nr:hypothetical protein C8F04DRAFT_1096259 [Mycena alexandri]
MALALTPLVHPDLRLEKLARLPSDIRRLAKLAAGGSLESLLRLQRPVQEGSEARSLLFLPVFYANIDTGAIPTPDEVDTTDPSPEVALESYPHLPDYLYPIFWPRVWPWIDFLDTHHFCLGGTHASLNGQRANRIHFLQQIRRFRSKDNVADSVNSTYGVWTMVARLWAFCVDPQRDMFRGGSSAATVICHFIGSPVSASTFDELVEALGGTQRDLATVLVQHLTLVACDPRNPLTPSNLFDLRCAIVFMAEATRCGLLFRPEFAATGLAKLLVESSCALSGISGDEAANLLRLTWNLLRWVLTENVLHKWIPSALKAGLLRAIVACATHSTAAMDISDFRQVLARDLPSSLVYYRVLRQMVKSLREVKTADLQNSAISDEWTAFLKLARARLEVFKSFQPSKSSQACDNMKCGAIYERNHFSVCSACRRRYYCSQVCQRSDWVAGDHKAACEVLLTDRIEHPEELNSRDRHFLRTLLHHDYRAARHDLWLQQIAFMHTHPGTDFYTRFDYSHGAVAVQVLSATSSNHPRDFEGSFRLAQAAASGGRMELHYMFLSAGSTARARWFPLRSSSSAISEGLRAIACSIEPGAAITERHNELLDDLNKLDEEVGGEVVQIH